MTVGKIKLIGGKIAWCIDLMVYFVMRHFVCEMIQLHFDVFACFFISAIHGSPDKFIRCKNFSLGMMHNFMLIVCFIYSLFV